jgi:citrate synthase
MPNVDQRRIDNQRSDFTSAAAAARLLDVKPATLYAYVSRGLLRSIPAPHGRARLYAVDDLERLRTRRDARRGHTAVAASALDWGAPVLDSAITRIDPTGPHYRGQSALELARSGRTFESVAELLWQGPARWQPDRAASRAHRALGRLRGEPMPPLALLAAFVSMRGLLDADRHAKDGALERDRAALLLHGMASVLALGDRAKLTVREAPLARVVCAALGLRASAREVALVDQMLVLCADHELNVSTFAVRVTASGGADLYACLTTGLSALSGSWHGGMCDRVELLAAACATPKDARRLVRARLAAGETIPGFGQPLYPDGDPRGSFLLVRASEQPTRKSSPRFATIQALVAAMRALGRRDPTLDIGLCAASAALALPPGAASAIFALGRVAGWVAPVLEQRERNVLLRPRARYVGV